MHSVAYTCAGRILACKANVWVQSEAPATHLDASGETSNTDGKRLLKFSVISISAK